MHGEQPHNDEQGQDGEGVDVGGGVGRGGEHRQGQLDLAGHRQHTDKAGGGEGQPDMDAQHHQRQHGDEADDSPIEIVHYLTLKPAAIVFSRL